MKTISRQHTLRCLSNPIIATCVNCSSTGIRCHFLVIVMNNIARKRCKRVYVCVHQSDVFSLRSACVVQIFAMNYQNTMNKIWQMMRKYGNSSGEIVPCLIQQMISYWIQPKVIQHRKRIERALRVGLWLIPALYTKSQGKNRKKKNLTKKTMWLCLSRYR